MKMTRAWVGKGCGLLLCLLLLTAAGCETMDKAQVGGLSGAGIGALAGQIIGGNTAATLIGAGVGAGLGYMIGNEMDKEDAKKRQAVTPQEVHPLANTVWTLISINPQPKRPFASLTSRFNGDGTVTTTKTYTDGKVETDTEYYRIVGSTLIVNKPDYVINARFRIDGSRMYLDAEGFGVVMQRI